MKPPTCDACGKARKTKRYEIHRLPDGSRGRHRRLDLCAEDAKALEHLFDLPKKLLGDEERRFTDMASLRRAISAGRA